MKMIDIHKPLLSSLCLAAVVALTACSEHTTEDGEAENHEVNDHGHDHAPHMGMMVPFTAGQVQAGFAEIKLHDDKGDLELWISKDAAGEQAMDFPLNTIVTVTFPKLDYKMINLKIRNAEKNEDEDGNGNIRDGKTNYFIFPGDSGADASFLMGKDFVADAIISFDAGGRAFSTKSFPLSPHIH